MSWEVGNNVGRASWVETCLFIEVVCHDFLYMLSKRKGTLICSILFSFILIIFNQLIKAISFLRKYSRQKKYYLIQDNKIIQDLQLLVDGIEINYIFEMRKSGINFQDITNKEWSIITKNEYADLQISFKKTQQRNGGISFYDLVNIIRNLGIPVSQARKDKLNKDMAIKQIRILDFHTLLSTAATLKKEREENSSREVHKENEYLDAFIALGGRPDKTGGVNKRTLIDIIKQQFELFLDLETIIEGVQSDNIDYQTFCSIFQQDVQNNEGRLISVASRKSLRTQESVQSLNFQEKDFQRLLQQYQNEDYS